MIDMLFVTLCLEIFISYITFALVLLIAHCDLSYWILEFDVLIINQLNRK